jgi:cyclopropane-fatty-acyl-phospholipid synthase
MRVSEAALSCYLRRLVRKGAIVLRYADGHVERYGEANVAAVVVQLHDRHVTRELLVNPSIGLGEAYMDGRLSVEGDNLYGLLEVLFVNLTAHHEAWPQRTVNWLRRLGRRVAQFSPEGRARRNVAHHYDLSDGLYDLFLDADRQYSCAYFRDPNDSLERAQEAKKDHIAAKLLLRPGQRVLDVGCGWGGLAFHLASAYGVQVTGVTLSQEQHRFDLARASASGLAERARFLLKDYRQMTGTFDRIVSVGMFEHVGVPHYQEFFAKVRDSLADDGVALIHTIGRAHGPAPTDPWIAKHIFPGGGIPALSEIVPTIERTGLILTDVEVWRLHYAATLKAWRTRFQANRERIRRLYDDRFCRMWACYLIESELAFRYAGLVVFQIQLAKRQDAVPPTRDYLVSPEGLSTRPLLATA